MTDCKISSILNTIGSTNANDLNPWCAGQYTKDKSFALGNNMTCTVNSSAYPKYPKGTTFTCQNGTIISVIKKPDGTIVDDKGNQYKDKGGGNIVADVPPINSPTTMSPTIIMVIVLIVIVLIAGGLFMFMGKTKVSSIRAFGRKLSKIRIIRR
jgi:hypothetical protein